MEYDQLTKDQKLQLLEGRIRQAEADHFNQSLTLGQQRAAKSEEAVKKSEEVIASIEAQLEYLRGQLKTLAGQNAK